MNLVDLLREFGPAVTAIAFFIWRDWKREERNTKQNEELNQFIRTELTVALKENTKAINSMVNHCKGINEKIEVTEED
jgi:hypothetical protein